MDISKKILNAIIENKLVFFVGSGLSIRFGLPSWKDLVKDIIREQNKKDYNDFLPLLESGMLTPIEVLEKLKKEHNDIRKYILTKYNIANGDFSLQKKLLEISGKIITTNFDNAFEKASNNTIHPSVYTSDFNISEINKSDNPYIFKLHGSFNEPDHCVIFKEDYDNIYLRESSAKEKLKAIFAEKTIIFIGYSFSDPEISLIFNNLDKTFSNNNKHYIITKEPREFEKYQFLEPIQISTWSDIDAHIDYYIESKKEISKIADTNNLTVEIIETQIPKIALLYPNPIELDFKDDLLKVVSNFDALNVNLHIGTLNTKTLLQVDDYDMLIIVSKVFKSNIYIEEDNLKSNLISGEEITSYLPNDTIPIVFITNEELPAISGYSCIHISTFKTQIINRFIYKALKELDLDIKTPEIKVNLKKWINAPINKGNSTIKSFYGNNKNLDIGKKSLTSVVGRIEEQSIIAVKLISIIKSNKFLNIKASGGTGKTTLIKKVAYELYNRGYYKEGISFKSCENVKSFADFEEILIDGFCLTNIIDFKSHLTENYTNNKIDLLIILDNFETVVNTLKEEDFKEVINLLKYATDFANIVITSREKITDSDEYEDVYSLTPLITDDALSLFQKNYGVVKSQEEIKILRTEILEDLLNNNPLAIKLVTTTRTRFKHINELKKQLTEHFFESTNENYSAVFKNNADLNIERTKSIYQSINYSYTTLNTKEKIAFELLNLFPDGISLSNFKKCFEKSNSSSNQINDKELRILRDKSLIEDYNGTLQLQPIIRRFAEFQFSKRPKDLKHKYCLDAYLFNCYVLDILDLVRNKNTKSEALKVYNLYKNNLLYVLTYFTSIDLDDKHANLEKKHFLNYIYEVRDFIVSEKQTNEFILNLSRLESYFSDLPNALTLIKVMNYHKTYYHQEFDDSYKKLSELLSVVEMENRILKNEDYIEYRYKTLISNIHSMEGYTLQMITPYVGENPLVKYFDAHFFYLGIIDVVSRKKNGFYYFEYELMFNRLDINALENHINSLYQEEHLQIMQCTYTLSKVKKIDKKTIQRLVVTNPYTRGLKELMFAFISDINTEKIKHFELAIHYLSHIRYYYLEALYYYCIYLKDNNIVDYNIKLAQGIELSSKFRYQYINFLFENIDNKESKTYNFTYSYYPLSNLEDFVIEHNEKWEKYFRENEIDA